MNGISIVPIREDHAVGFWEALGSVAREKKFLAWTDAPPLDSAQAFVRRNIEGGVIQLVALDGERVVGWCDIMRFSRDAFNHVGMLGIGVVKEYRGRGIGRALLSEALAAAKRKGIKRVELHVYTDNAPAIALYEKMGFVMEGKKIRSTLLEGEYKDDYIMAMWIGDE